MTEIKIVLELEDNQDGIVVDTKCFEGSGETWTALRPFALPARSIVLYRAIDDMLLKMSGKKSGRLSTLVEILSLRAVPKLVARCPKEGFSKDTADSVFEEAMSAAIAEAVEEECAEHPGEEHAEFREFIAKVGKAVSVEDLNKAVRELKEGDQEEEGGGDEPS